MALLTVLLLVAVMSALAVGVMEDIRFGVRREANAETSGQAQWYGLGAETLVRARLMRLAAAPRTLPDDANGAWLTFPVENGILRARISDAAECFNLNSVVEGASEQWRQRERGMRQFVVLLKHFGTNEAEAQALAETLADWIDTDSVRGARGSEDETYANMAQPYRTSGTLLSEVSELRAIRGFTPEIYARLRPFVCALPTADLSPINVNLLEPGQAVLLTMLMDDAVSPEVARRVIASRPPQGWPSVEAFWNNPSLRDHLPPDDVLAQVSLRTRFYGLEADIQYAGGEAVMTSLFEQENGGKVRLKSRRWTIDE